MDRAERREPSKRANRRREREIPGEQYLKKRSDSETWQISFKIKHRRIREGTGTRDLVTAAELALKRWNEVYREIHFGEKPVLELTIFDAFSRFWDEVASTSDYGRQGQRYHMRVLTQALGRETLLSQIDDTRVNQAVQWMRTRVPKKGRPAQLSPSTINRYLTTLSVVCRRAAKIWGAEVGSWSKSDHTSAEPEGREVFLDHQQAQALLEASSGHLRPILLLGLLTGLRLQNLVSLDWSHVSLDMARIVLVQKGRRRHSVSLAPPALYLLENSQPDPDKRTGPVWWFGNPAIPCNCPRCSNQRYHGDPIRSIKRTFATAVHTAGLDELAAGRMRFHDIRHTFASWLLHEGGNLKLVQEVLGHKHIATTARYAHLLPGQKESTIAAVATRLLTADAPQPKSTERVTKPRKTANS